MYTFGQKTTAKRCDHLKDATGKTVTCPTCLGNVQLKVFGCALHGECTLGRKKDGLSCCAECPDSTVKVTAPSLRWAYCVTTVPQRLNYLLPQTLTSLRKAGFDSPLIFVDGASDPSSVANTVMTVDPSLIGLTISCRWPAVRAHCNWMLSLSETFMRSPDADRYAVFQDDLLAVGNLRAYLNHCMYPTDGYLNLYTFPENQSLAPRIGQTARFRTGWYRSNQKGLGAVALVFNREAVLDVLTSRHMVERPVFDPKAKDPGRRFKAIDGGVVSAMRKAGRWEYVHNPSLVQHTGTVSTVGNGRHPQAPSFEGEDSNAVNLTTRG